MMPVRKGSSAVICGALAALAGVVLMSRASAAPVDAFGGASVFSAGSAIRNYYANSNGGSRPLLQVFLFLPRGHYLLQLRDSGSGSGTMSWQAYLGGAKRTGRGTFAVHGHTLRARGSGGLRFVAVILGSQIRIVFTDSVGTDHASGRLQRFSPGR
jgi:hypothetical protein